LYDRQFRRSTDQYGKPLEDGGGPLVRGSHGRARVLMSREPELGATGSALDALIHEQLADGVPVHWRLHGHDRPAELGERLLAAGFTVRRSGTVLVGEAARLTGEVALPAGVTIRRTTDPADTDRIAEQHSVVWGEDLGYLARLLKDRLANSPGTIEILLAEAADGTLVCSGWLRLREDSDFAGLLGGSTLREWQGRGIYRALVAERARIAEQRGYRYLHVEASEASAPILRRLGFQPISTVTQYQWAPPA
jgi:GNAT superfamily N-acetyltransferase